MVKLVPRGDERMPKASDEGVTQLLRRWRDGDETAFAALAPRVDVELRRLAVRAMRRERPGHTLQPTALVNEAWLRLSGESGADYADREHFMAIAARAMRRILVEHARRRLAQKRGAGEMARELDEVVIADVGRSADLIALDDGLRALAAANDRQVKVVELHYFGGLTFEEIARSLSLGRSTVIRDLRLAQLWLRDYVAA